MVGRRSPFFYKILLDASAPHLPLPPVFVSRHLEDIIPKAPMIRSAIGSYSWPLKIKKIGESYCFSDGWNNVVRDIQLRFGDFLLFRLVDKTIFKMFVFSPNGCEKDIPLKIDDDSGAIDDNDFVVKEGDDDYDDNEEDEIEVEDDEDFDEDEEEEYVEEKDEGDDDEVDGDDDGVGDIDGDDGDPFFMLIISKTHKNMLRLPPEFAELAGIDGEGTLTLRNCDGKKWQTSVRLEKWHQSERYCISAGWSSFRRSNDLCEGDECVFKFIRGEDILLLAKVTKKKRPAMQPKPSGEPPATEVVKKRVNPQGTPGDILAAKVEKMERGRAPRERDGVVDMEREEERVAVVKRSRGRPPKQNPGKPPAMQPNPSSEAPATEVVKKRVQPKRNPREDPAAKVDKRKRRDHRGGVHVEAVKRSRGRPSKRPRKK